MYDKEITKKLTDFLANKVIKNLGDMVGGVRKERLPKK